MNEPITLSRQEYDAAIKALKKNTGRSFEHQLVGVVRAINEARSGDPVGTVRRGTREGKMAVRVAPSGDSDLRWRIVASDGSTDLACDSRVQGWSVIYIPEVSS